MLGVIDIGSNTIRLVAYHLKDGAVQSILNKKYGAGLIGYVDNQNRLSNEGIELLVDILAELNQLAKRLKLESLYPFATASLRNISNTESVLDKVKQECDLTIEVLTDKEEATLDYYGAVRSFRLEEGLLVDVGGGSTELVFYRQDKPVILDSLPIGSLNTFHRYVSQIIPDKKEIYQIYQDTINRLRQISLIEPISANTICGVGGSARATQQLLNQFQGLPKNTNNYRCDQLQDIWTSLVEDKIALSRQILKSTPERIHTFLPGVAIIQAVADFYDGKQILTSNYGVREGYLHRILEQRSKTQDG